MADELDWDDAELVEDSEQRVASRARRQCQGKIRRKRKDAKRLAKERTRERAEPWSAYRCVNCEAWHVGHARAPDAPPPERRV